MPRIGNPYPEEAIIACVGGVVFSQNSRKFPPTFRTFAAPDETLIATLKTRERPVTSIRIDKATSPTAAFGAVVHAFMPAAARKEETGAEPASRLTDKKTLEAIARLNDHQLDDIGVYRVARIEPNRSARHLDSERTVVFDYFYVES